MSTKSVSPFSSPALLLARLTKLTSTIPGLDASLMLAQYSSPLIIALLLRLASFRAQHPRLRLALGGGNSSPGGFGLVKLAEGWGRAAGSIADARVIMRAFGMLPILQWLFVLHPKPLASLRSFFLSLGSSKASQSEKALPTLQILSLLAYYPLEHISWLASKGVVPLTPSRLNTTMLWSVRFWALYVVLEIYKLRNTYIGLLGRTRALRHSKPEIKPSEAEGFELQDTTATSVEEKIISPPETPESSVAKVQQIKKDWASWKTAVIVNSGYAPLTMHWSTPGGLWSNPLITGALGTVAAWGQLTNEWRKGDP
ncbi:hypothetical protein CI109_103629 [Kwoniella shandongensis]|uniref:Uncharacterized protein n=1 Tax=Kwoniella shandongensis TaxID=1734106 RepID=A0A5M6C7J5_9TREE|nr:uncharacterized protein CI109_000679 [Kwoniella shandongensis]KAA5531107.1 hypothetical protein CI109_000679 [Kwoniella shandongensis]